MPIDCTFIQSPNLSYAHFTPGILSSAEKTLINMTEPLFTLRSHWASLQGRSNAIYSIHGLESSWRLRGQPPWKGDVRVALGRRDGFCQKWRAAQLACRTLSAYSCRPVLLPSPLFCAFAYCFNWFLCPPAPNWTCAISGPRSRSQLGRRRKLGNLPLAPRLLDQEWTVTVVFHEGHCFLWVTLFCSYSSLRVLETALSPCHAPKVGHSLVRVRVQSLSPVQFLQPHSLLWLARLLQGIFKARMLEWVAISSSRGSSRPRDQTQVSRISKRIPYHWAIWEVPGHSLTVSKFGVVESHFGLLQPCSHH